MIYHPRFEVVNQLNTRLDTIRDMLKFMLVVSLYQDRHDLYVITDGDGNPGSKYLTSCEEFGKVVESKTGRWHMWSTYAFVAATHYPTQEAAALVADDHGESWFVVSVADRIATILAAQKADLHQELQELQTFVDVL